MKTSFKKLAALSAACVMALSLTACGEDTATIGKIGGIDVPAGIYLYNSVGVYNEVSMKKTEEQASVWDVTVDGKTAEQYITDEALLRTKKFVAIEKKFDELGLTLTEKEKDYYIKSAESAYEQSKEAFIDSGISVDSLSKLVINDAKYAALFAAYYDAETGIEPIKASEINKYIKDNYARVEIVQVSLKDADGNLLKGADKEKAINRAKSYLKRAETEDFAAIIYDESNYRLKQSAESSGTEYEPFVYNPDEIEEYSLEEIIDKEYPPVPASAAEEIFAHKADGKPFLIESSENYYVVKRLNILEREGIVDTYKATVLQALKSEEFKALETKWAEELDMEWNEKAKERYAPKKLKVAVE